MIHLAKILSIERSDVDFNDDPNLNIDEILAPVGASLYTTEVEQKACQGRTILPTARQVIVKKYPSTSTSRSDISDEHIQPEAGEYIDLLILRDKVSFQIFLG